MKNSVVERARVVMPGLFSYHHHPPHLTHPHLHADNSFGCLTILKTAKSLGGVNGL